MNGLAGRAFAAERAAGIRLEIVPSTPGRGRLSGTSQVAAADRFGYIAALITSLSRDGAGPPWSTATAGL